jgi:hypothetical protein
MTSMRESDFDDTLDDDDEDSDPFFAIENQPLYRQWRTERWLMEILLWPAKAPRPHPVEKLTWMAGNQADLAVILTALEHDGLIQRDDESVSATKAAISLRRLEMRRAGPW